MLCPDRVFLSEGGSLFLVFLGVLYMTTRGFSGTPYLNVTAATNVQNVAIGGFKGEAGTTLFRGINLCQYGVYRYLFFYFQEITISFRMDNRGTTRRGSPYNSLVMDNVSFQGETAMSPIVIFIFQERKTCTKTNGRLFLCNVCRLRDLFYHRRNV